MDQVTECRAGPGPDPVVRSPHNSKPVQGHPPVVSGAVFGRKEVADYFGRCTRSRARARSADQFQEKKFNFNGKEENVKRTRLVCTHRKFKNHLLLIF